MQKVQLPELSRRVVNESADVSDLVRTTIGAIEKATGKSELVSILRDVSNLLGRMSYERVRLSEKVMKFIEKQAEADDRRYESLYRRVGEILGADRGWFESTRRRRELEARVAAGEAEDERREFAERLLNGPVLGILAANEQMQREICEAVKAMVLHSQEVLRHLPESGDDHKEEEE